MEIAANESHTTRRRERGSAHYPYLFLLLNETPHMHIVASLRRQPQQKKTYMLVMLLLLRRLV